MAKSKAELLDEARQRGVEIPASKTISEIKRILAEAAPVEPVLDAQDQTVPGDAENAPSVLTELAGLDDPKAPLAHTPAEGLTEYDAVGNLGAKHEDPDVRVPDDGGVPPEVARGPLPGTPPDGYREDYWGPRQVAGSSQPVNTDPHQQGGTDTQPDQPNPSRDKLQESANAPGGEDRPVAGGATGRPEDGDAGKGAAKSVSAPAPGVPSIKTGI